jgi:hypothetical protein
MVGGRGHGGDGTAAVAGGTVDGVAPGSYDGTNRRLPPPMTGQHRSPAPESGRRSQDLWVPNLAITADVSRGRSNLASVPRAGNISTDTRAG